MEFGITLGIVGWIVLIAGAIVFGVIAQVVGETQTGYEWLVDAIAFAIGALVASEFVVAWRGIEPVWDGLAIVPAVGGGLVVGVIAELITRFSTGGRYFHRPMSV